MQFIIIRKTDVNNGGFSEFAIYISRLAIFSNLIMLLEYDMVLI